MMKHSDYMSAAPHSAAINVTGSNKVTSMLHRWDSLLISDIISGLTAPPPCHSHLPVVLSLLTGLQIQRGVQQHHSPLLAYGGQRAEQRTPPRPERNWTHPDLDQAV